MLRRARRGAPLRRPASRSPRRQLAEAAELPRRRGRGGPRARSAAAATPTGAASGSTASPGGVRLVARNELRRPDPPAPRAWTVGRSSRWRASRRSRSSPTGSRSRPRRSRSCAGVNSVLLDPDAPRPEADHDGGAEAGRRDALPLQDDEGVPRPLRALGDLVRELPKPEELEAIYGIEAPEAPDPAQTELFPPRQPGRAENEETDRRTARPSPRPGGGTP